MVNAPDSSGTGNAGTEGPGSGSSGPAATTPPDSVPREKYDADIAEERRRRAGQERAHQKAVDELGKKIDRLEAILSSPPEDNISLDDISDPVVRTHLARIYSSTREWQEDIIKRDGQTRAQAALDEAVGEAINSGVPREAIDESSLETARLSVKDYLHEKRVRDLESKIESLTKERDQAGAVARAEAGATMVSTATGRAPSTQDQLLAEVASRRDMVLREQEGAKLRPGPDSMVLLRKTNQALALLDQQEHGIKEGRVRELPPIRG